MPTAEMFRVKWIWSVEGARRASQLPEWDAVLICIRDKRDVTWREGSERRRWQQTSSSTQLRSVQVNNLIRVQFNKRVCYFSENPHQKTNKILTTSSWGFGSLTLLDAKFLQGERVVCSVYSCRVISDLSFTYRDNF